MMEIVRTVQAMRERAAAWRADGRRVGLVPTMGCFHEGHLSLMRASVADCGATAVSLFVNPAQFGPAEDLAQYPRDFDRDCALAEKEGVDAMFSPEPPDIYPEGFRTCVKVEGWSDLMCGGTRPIHFRGVTTVCCKLFHIVQPHRAYFGWKDAQQALIIRRMVRDLDMDLEIVTLPTAREADGLAMSSRNVYLNAGERRDAARLYASLCEAKRMVASGTRDAGAVRAKMEEIISGSPHARIDYIEMVSPDTLEAAPELAPGTLIALAAFFGKTRLIDNIIL